MALCKLWIVQVVSVTGFFYLGAVFTSSIAAAATYNFIANQRPRFQIPHGNLSYYRSPQWEVLYYLKFGIFPFYSTSSPYFNRTHYLDKIRTIKTLIDRRNSKTKYGLEDENEAAGAGAAAEIDPTIAAAVVTDLPEAPHQNHQILDLSQSSTSSSSLAGGGGGGEGSMEDNKSWNKNVVYYPLTQIKENLHQLVKTKLKGKEEDKKKRKTTTTLQKKTGAGGVIDDDDVVNEYLLQEMDPALDYFLVDGDPSWLRSRVTKQIGDMGSSARGLYSGSGGGGGNGPGLAAEMTVERKVGRKFQTQGWKK